MRPYRGRQCPLMAVIHLLLRWRVRIASGERANPQRSPVSYRHRPKR